MILREFIEKMIRDVGPRPAGSESEFRAVEIIAGEFSRRGAAVTFHDATTSPNFIRNMINLMTVMYGLSLVLYLIVPAAASALITFMLLVLFLSRAVGNHVVNWMFSKAATRNVDAVYRPSGEVRNVLIFSGHHDSPNMMPLFYSPLKRHVSLVENAAALGAVLLIPAGILNGLAAGIAAGWYQALYGVSVAGFAVALFFRFTMISKVRNLGANDNLSAVAVLIGIAEHLKNEKLKHTEVHLVSFGAEEPDLAGSAAWARDHGELLKKAVNVNMETVGAGVLAVISREKMAGVSYTTSVVDLVGRAGGRAGLHVPSVKISYGGTDSASLIKRGGKSACLFGMDETELFSLWHSPEDRPDNISEENLQNALRICLQVIAMTEEERK